MVLLGGWAVAGGEGGGEEGGRARLREGEEGEGWGG